MHLLRLLLIILLLFAAQAHAQFTQQCTTPSFTGTAATAGVMQLRADGPQTQHYYTVDSLALKIYGSPCTPAPLYQYNFNATERGAYGRYAYVAYHDFTGDGIYEIYLTFYWATPRLRWALKILNPVNNATVFQRSDANLSCVSYPYWAADLDGDGELELPVLIQNAGGTQYCEIYNTGVSVPNAAGERPTRAAAFSLEQNFPNPFNPATRIEYTLAVPGHARVEVFDVLGRQVVTLADGPQPAGVHTLNWNAAEGTPLPSGTYFYQLTVDGIPAGARQMLLVR